MDQLNKEFIDACLLNDVSKVYSLVRQGADVNYNAGDGRTALMKAAKRNFIEIVKFLIDNGADVRARDKDNKTALMGAAKKGNLEVCKLLVEAGAQVDAHDNNMRTALHRAAFLGQDHVVEYLVEKGAEQQPGRFAGMGLVYLYVLTEPYSAAATPLPAVLVDGLPLAVIVVGGRPPPNSPPILGEGRGG